MDWAGCWPVIYGDGTLAGCWADGDCQGGTVVDVYLLSDGTYETVSTDADDHETLDLPDGVTVVRHCGDAVLYEPGVGWIYKD